MLMWIDLLQFEWSVENFPISNFAKLLLSIFSVLNLLWTPVNCKCIDDTILFFTLGPCVDVSCVRYQRVFFNLNY